MGLSVDSYTPQASVLGAILCNPKFMGEAMQQLTGEEFSHPSCKVVWSAMTVIFRRGQSIDPVVVLHELSGYPEAGSFLHQLMEQCPAFGNFEPHLQALKEQSQRDRLREIALAMTETYELAELQHLLDKANRLSIQKQARERRNMLGMFENFGERHAQTVQPDYLRWPFSPLNDGIRVKGGKYLILGGYPSDGKTAFALACACHQASTGKRTVFYSFETDTETAEDRIIAATAGISLRHIQDNALTESEWAAFGQISSASDWPLEIVSAAGMTVDDIRADALACHAEIIYIDYLQLISIGRYGKGMTRFDAVTAISMGLQQLAKSTGITVIALSQMTRPQDNKEPDMHNLRESGQIEQDADVIMLLFRKDTKNIRAPRKLKIEKNKEGRTGRFWLDFDGEYQRFAVGSEPQEKPKMPAPAARHLPPPKCEQESFLPITRKDPNLPF